MESTQYHVIRPDGEVLGPADRATVQGWADGGRIPADSQLRHPDGREESVLLDESLARAIEAAGQGAVRHPGRRELVSGAIIGGGAAALMLGSVASPGALNLVPGKGHHGVNQTYWWIILGIAAATGVLLLLRGLREQRRARLAKELEES